MEVYNNCLNKCYDELYNSYVALENYIADTGDTSVAKQYETVKFLMQIINHNRKPCFEQLTGTQKFTSFFHENYIVVNDLHAHVDFYDMYDEYCKWCKINSSIVLNKSEIQKKYLKEIDTRLKWNSIRQTISHCAKRKNI